MAPERDIFSCFNKKGRPRGHFFSCHDLYAAGVWIGYLSPEKHGQSFKGLPSFNQLKKNCQKFNPPFPPGIPGVACEERYAVCRGCFSGQSQLITLREVNFMSKMKLVVMPLDGTDDEGMFCILLPQPTDRSLQGIQAYRPYEYTKGGQGQTFASNIMLLGLRNNSQSSGTLEAVRVALEPPETASKQANNESLVSPAEATASRSGRSASTTDRNYEHNAGQCTGRASEKRNLSDGSSENERPFKRQETETLISRAQKPTPGSRETTGPPSSMEHNIPTSTPRNTGSAPAIPEVIPLDLTDEQSKRIRLIWMVEAEAVEYEFGHPLSNCATFSKYLELLQEDAADDREVIEILQSTRVWRMTYQLSGAPKKAFTVRLGDDTGFERLQQSLLQSSFWEGNPKSKIDVMVRALK